MGAVGPIPWTAMNEYARTYEFDEEQREALFYYIRHMDLVVISKSRPKQAAEKQAKPAVRTGNTMRR